MAHDLSPADVILFKQHRFASFITDLGGATSHTAILARSLNIPSIVALHHARSLIRENELLIVDGSNGVVIVNPDKNVLAEYELRQEQWQLERQKLKRLKTTRAATLDGTRVELHANIELPDDVARPRRTLPPASACSAASSCSSTATSCPPRTSSSRPTARSRSEMEACRSPYARSTWVPTSSPERCRARRAQPGAGPARDPPVPGRAADVPSPAARDPARVALRQDPHPDPDAVHGARAQPDHAPDRTRPRRAWTRTASPTTATSRSAA